MNGNVVFLLKSVSVVCILVVLRSSVLVIVVVVFVFIVRFCVDSVDY